MSVSKKLSDLFKEKRVPYELLKHPETYTSQETARSEHVSGKKVAKVVMVKADDQDVMTVLSAADKLSLNKLKNLLGAKEVRLATEEEFKALFPDCEVGAMPPFGSLYRVPFFVDMGLAENKFIIFNAGTHRESVKISYKDYAKIAQPEIVQFAAEGV